MIENQDDYNFKKLLNPWLIIKFKKQGSNRFNRDVAQEQFTHKNIYNSCGFGDDSSLGGDDNDLVYGQNGANGYRDR
jgi:hypothetical protein